MRVSGKRTLVRATALVLIAVFPACSDITIGGVDLGDLEFCPDGVVSPVTIGFSLPSLSMRVGQSVPLQAIPRDAKGEYALCSPSGVWSTTDAAVARYESGHVHAVGNGRAYIRYAAGSRTDSVLVTVATPTVALVTVGPPAAIVVGQTLRIGVVANDSAGNALDGWKAGFSTSDANVATISPTGLLIANNPGSVKVTADVEGVTGSITYSITAGAPSVTFKEIAAGRNHTCAIASGGKLPDGTIACWGNGSSGQLGVGSSPFSSEPVTIGAGTSFSTIAAGSHHTCALSIVGEAWCWGSETVGELGDGTMAGLRATPVRVLTQLKFAGIALGDGHSCALTPDGLAYCWGYMKGRSSLLPARVEGIPKLKQLVSEGGMACGLSESGSVYCWGETDVVGSLITRENPAQIGGGITFASISAGVYHSCGITQLGAGYCWGFNQQNQMGPTASQRVLTPVALPGGLTFGTIAAGGFTTCGITASGAQCIGMSQLPGSQASPGTFIPVPRESEHRFVAMSGGGNHTCAIDVRGGVWCWGNNSQYQTGITEGIVVSEPLQIRIN